MPSTDLLEFVKNSRQHLHDAIKASGVTVELNEIAHKSQPWGSWKLPVIIFASKKPIAKFWLTYPERDGQKTVKFNIETFETIAQWLRQNPQQTSPSITTDAQSSF